MKNKTISIIGLGYIGLPTLLLVASKNKNCKVIGYDTNLIKINYLNNKKLYIKEKRLNNLFKNNKNVKFVKNIEESDIYIICVPTPLINNKADISFVKQATTSLVKKLKKNDIVIFESTVPAGTTNQMIKLIKSMRPDLKMPLDYYSTSDINVAYCPERVLPGNIINELINNDRIVGSLNLSSAKKIRLFFSSFVKGKIHLTDILTAELSKLAENSFRDVNISFANEIANVCEKVGVDHNKVIELSNQHPRVNILKPGIGVGGHCIAVDPMFLIETDKSLKLIKEARKLNNQRPKKFISIINNIINSEPKKKIKVSFLGITYKPNVDDMRESPAIEILKGIKKKKNVKMFYVEPNIKLPLKLLNDLNFEKISTQEAIKSSDLIFLLVGHKFFDKYKGVLENMNFYNFCGFAS